MSRKRRFRHRSHLIFHFFLLLILFAELLSLTPSGKDKMMSDFSSEDRALSSPERAIELTDEEVKNQIRSIVDEIYGRDKSMLAGVESVLVSREDIDFLGNATECDGHLLGAFSDGKILIKESGLETNRRTLYHEVGHNVWGKLSEEKRGRWRVLFSSSTGYASAYAGKNAGEDFAESFSCRMTESPSCAQIDEEKKIFIGAIV